MYKKHSKLFSVDEYQIVIFESWYQDASWINSTFKDIENKDNLTETGLDHFWKNYIVQNTHNTHSH